MDIRNNRTKLINDLFKNTGIQKGKREEKEISLGRVIYSILGKQFLSALSETEDASSGISVEQAKDKVRTSLDGYRKVFPEINAYLAASDEEIAEHIYEIYSKTGFFYHIPYKIFPSPITKARLNETMNFIRGFRWNKKDFMSGLGFYTQNEDSGEECNTSVQSLFHLSLNTLAEAYEFWQEMESEFVEISGQNLEFLQQEYWKNGYFSFKSDKTGALSLCRTLRRFPGNEPIYYLYQYRNGHILGKQIPEWQSRQGNYLSIANCLLHHDGHLPACRYELDGSIVFLRLGYLYPPEEMNFLRLYSWPSYFLTDNKKRQFGIDSPFERIMANQVFAGFRAVMEQKGYKVERGDWHGKRSV